jgi:hypothetical protein
MDGTVTFKNVNLLDSRSVDHAVGILWELHRHAKQSVELLGHSEAEVREQYARTHTFTIVDPNANLTVEDGEGVDLDPVPTKPQVFYRGSSKQLIEVMQERIAKNGMTTLEDSATVMGVTLDTARAFLRNAGRTNRAHGIGFPFEARWNHDKGYNEYFSL